MGRACIGSSPLASVTPGDDRGRDARFHLMKSECTDPTLRLTRPRSPTIAHQTRTADVETDAMINTSNLEACRFQRFEPLPGFSKPLSA